MSEWSVAEPRKLTFDEPVSELQVRIVNGTVNVVGTDESSPRLEISEIEGPPLMVTQRDGTLTVAYEDLPWKGFLKWLDRKGWRRSAVISLAVPVRTRVEVGVVSANAMLSGVEGRAEVKGISGDTTLVGLAGQVRADTVSGSLDAQALSGDLRFNSVSGDLTVVEAGSSVKAESVSGSMIVDLDPAGRPTDINLTSVSGEIAIRLPHPADAEVEANTASGHVSNAFEDLRVGGQWGAKRITGRLGAGNGRLKATTVSGSIALLRRPATEEEPWDLDPLEAVIAPEEPRATERQRPEPRQTENPEDKGDAGNSGNTENTADRTPEATPDATPEATSESASESTSEQPSGETSGDRPRENAASGPDTGDSAGPTDGTTDKKVL
ncbi:DUF4097 domain-containing protein [Streptomyces sp. NPDC056716]|uniref:DUF4097 family beta strand repeat-containing protein n=1 Tax=unclassified Streptomyces TaxID=2593676 RepID=UPI003697FD0F